jgi:mannan endo-1,4-beta-mannosidase
MNLNRVAHQLSFIMFLSFTMIITAGDFKPANPDLSPEARALLELLHNISGKYTLSGQHNYPNAKSRNSQFAAKYIGKTPIIFSTDFGFAKEGDKDSYLARPDIIEEVIKQHQKGSIITIVWHAVPPTANEPITFQPNSKNSSPDSLASVQGKLLDQQFNDLLTPGTEIYKHWCAQVDTIASYLKKLQQMRIPVLWRPYHEMNGNWFWWGGRSEMKGTAALYRQLFDRFVNYHKLNNLIWVWSVDRPLIPERQFSFYYPGNEYLDVLALDVYGSDFNQSYYDSLNALSNGKPIALAEVGPPPTPDILKKQPNWVYCNAWAGGVRGMSKKQYADLMNNSNILFKEDPAYQTLIAPYRKVSGLPEIIVSVKPTVDFSGEWEFNEDKSLLDNMGMGNLPSILRITQYENDITVQKSFEEEYTDDRITVDHLTLDGKDNKSVMWNSPVIMKATWLEKSDTLVIESKASIKWGDRIMEMSSNEKWFLQEQSKVLSIIQSSNSFRGQRKITMVFDKK